MATLVAGLVGCSAPTEANEPAEPEPVRGFWVAGYHPWWLKDAWQAYDLSTLGKILFFDLSVGADGTLSKRNGWPGAWAPMVARMHEQGLAVVPTVSILDTPTFQNLFSEPAHTQALRRALVGLVAETSVDGVHLDFEVFDGVTPYVRRAFVSFVRDLRADLDAERPGLYLSVFTLALDEHDAYDEGALAEHVDYLVVQGYDFHWSGDSQAGPVAPLSGWGRKNWQSVVDRYLSLQVPRGKIVMSVPYYGYEWPTTSDAPGAATRGPGTFTTYAPLPVGQDAGLLASAREQAAAHGLRRDPASQSPYYAYRDSSGWRQGWYEDAVSLRAKYDFVKRQQLGGVAIFPVGYGDAELDAVLRDAFGTAPSNVAARRAGAVRAP